MWKPKRLSIKNLLSHKHTTFEFNNNNATMIVGVNNTNLGQKSNGSGKSALIEGVSIAITGESLRPVSIKEMVRYGTDCAAIVFQMTNTKTGDEMEITRKIYSNTKSSEIMLTVNGEVPKGVVKNSDEKLDVRDAQNRILEIIGISKEDLKNYFIISGDRSKSFFEMGDAAKKQVISRFSQSNLIDPVFPIVDNKLSDIDSDIQQANNSIHALQGKIEGLEEEIEHNKLENLKKAHKDKISALEERLKDKRSVLESATEELKKVEAEVSKMENETIDTPSSEKEMKQLKKVNASLKEIRDEITEIDNELDEANELLSKAEKSILGVVKCPKCDTEFNPSDESVDVDQVKEDIKEIKSVIDECTSDKKEFKDEKQKLSDEKRELESSIEELEEAENELSRKLKQKTLSLQNIRDRIDSNNSSIDTMLQELEDLKDTVLEDGTKRLKSKIKEYQKDIKQLQEDLKEMELSRFYEEEWKNVFTRFKTHLSNKTIGVIQAYCNEYLRRMKTDISLRIDGYKMNRNGKISEKITTNILRGGVPEGQYDAFSKGERARMNVAGILTNKSLINASCPTGGLDLCFMDEVFDGLDSRGIESIMKVLDSLGETIVVVTHGTFDKKYQNCIFVEKNKGISEIIP